jgi:hypothetical protein
MPATSSAPPTNPAALLCSDALVAGAPATVGSVSSGLGAALVDAVPAVGELDGVGATAADAVPAGDAAVLLDRADDGAAAAELRAGLGAAEAVRVGFGVGDAVGRLPGEPTTGAHSPRG